MSQSKSRTMANHTTLIVQFLTLLFIVSSAQETNRCNINLPPETACPISNGFQEFCHCLPFGGGCWCTCPPQSENVDGNCYVKPTKIGESCNFFDSCNQISNAVCNTTTETCQCRNELFPSNDLQSCIAAPTMIDDTCSNFAPSCEDHVPGSSCQPISGSDYQCKCLTDRFPNVDDTKCFPKPKVVGDFCSVVNPCDQIPSAACVGATDGNVIDEPTCQCPLQYVPNTERNRCLPTKIGVRCTEGSPCEKIEGAQCFGRADIAICLCLWTIPNIELTKCLKMEDESSNAPSAE